MRTWVILLLPAVLGAVLLVSCDDVTDPLEGVDLLLQTPPLGAIVALEVRDARTGEQLSSGFSLEIAGPDAAAAVDLLDNHRTEYSTNVGVLSFGVSVESAPSPEDPVDLVLKVTADGYLETSRPVHLTGVDAEAIIIFVVDLANPPPGVAVTTAPATADALGAVTATVDLQAEDGGGGVHVTIPAGTVLRDAAGALVTGSLEVRAVYFNNTVDEALVCFPGGFLVDTTTDGPGAFFSAGFTALEISNGHQTAVSFVPDVQVEMTVPPKTMNPDTKALVARGDEIPVWSYDPVTGAWAAETSVTVGSKSGDTVVSFATSHFSTWNLDWHRSTACAGSTITFKGQFNALYVRILDVETGQYLSYGHLVTGNDPVIHLQYAPENRPVRIIAFSNQDHLGHLVCGSAIWSDIAGQTSVANLCADGIEVEIDTANTVPDSSLLSVTVDVELFCPTGDVALRPNGVLYLLDPCGGYQFLAAMNQGHLKADNLRIGDTYNFTFQYDGVWYPFTYTVDREHYEFRAELPELCP